MDLPLEEETTSTRLEKSGPAALSFQGLAFHRQNSSFQIAPLYREFPAGCRVAIQGSNGSGKSTLTDLLYGLKAPSQGTLLIDGVDYRELGLEELRRHVALVRNIDIVSGSILDNVVFGRKDVTPALAKEALRKVGVLDEFLQLKDGVNTQLTDNGAPLSLGYAQLLVLARAIAASPRVLVIDEMVDGLDPQTRDAVLNVLLDRSAPWTLILSTQNPDVAKRFDEVLELGTQTNGRVA
jgi:ABC-type bacteriocin/lantibiotic exporter with double-glycine peptidase domain